MKVEVEFLAFYANAPRPSIRHCFSCGSWFAWRNNTKLKTLSTNAALSALALFLIKTTAGGGREGERTRKRRRRGEGDGGGREKRGSARGER